MKVLIVSGSEKGRNGLCPMFSPPEYESAVAVKSGSEALILSEADEFDLIIVNTPLCDGFGTDTALALAGKTTAGVMIIVCTQDEKEVSDKVSKSGVFVVLKPINPAVFESAVRLCITTRNRLCGLKNENVRLKTTIDELRLVQRAKSALMEYLKMSEPAAHRYIERQAMDLRITKREVAQSIIRMYEN